MNPFGALAMAAGLLVWFLVLIALLRWPGRTLGFAAALLAWTVVGPWAFWAVLGLTFIGVRVRRRCGTPGRSLRRQWVPSGADPSRAICRWLSGEADIAPAPDRLTISSIGVTTHL